MEEERISNGRGIRTKVQVDKSPSGIMSVQVRTGQNRSGLVETGQDTVGQVGTGRVRACSDSGN